MKFMHLFGVVVIMTATASTAPAEITEKPSAETLTPSYSNAWGDLATVKERTDNIGVTASDGIASATAGSAVYNLDTFINTIRDTYNANTPLLQRNEYLMRGVFRGEIKLTKAVKDEIKANLASMAAHSLTVAKELERTVAGMAALATPPGSPYKNINQAQTESVYFMMGFIDGLMLNIRLVITDKQGSVYIRPFLWDFASQEILQGQRFASRMEKPLRQLVPFIRASEKDTEGVNFYLLAKEYIFRLVGSYGSLTKYVNWPAPPPGAKEAPEIRSDDGSASLLQSRNAGVTGATGNHNENIHLIKRAEAAAVVAAATTGGVDLWYLIDVTSQASSTIAQNTALIQQTMQSISAGTSSIKDPKVRKALHDALSSTRSHLQNISGSLYSAVSAMDKLRAAKPPKIAIGSQQAVQLRKVSVDIIRMLNTARRGVVNSQNNIRPLLRDVDKVQGGVGGDIEAGQDAAKAWPVWVKRIMAHCRNSGSSEGLGHKEAAARKLDEVAWWADYYGGLE